MKWVDALEAVLSAVVGDSVILAALGGAHVYRAGAHRAPQVPSIEYLVVSNPQEENTQILRTQWDLWFPSSSNGWLTVEERLRQLFDVDGVATINGVRMFAQFDDAGDLPDPDPGVIHRMLEFVFQPVREERP